MAENGVQFPKGADGKRSTSDTGKRVFAASAAGADSAEQNAVSAIRNWRFGYAKAVVRHVELGAKSPENALKMAKAGLKYVHENFVFVRDGKEMPMHEAMSTIKGHKFETAVIKGTRTKPKTFELEVPYGDKVLRGNDILVQVDKWVKNGTIEMSCGHAISQVVKRREWLDLSDKYFVLLGALSAMGPLRVLLALGANVVAIDINRPGVWESLIDIARNSCGTITFPVSQKQADLKTDADLCKAAGCNLLEQTPEVKNWLLQVHPDKPITVGSYAYLDSDLFVRLSVAMDAIVQDLCSERKNVAIAFLCTPTDCHLIPPAAHQAQVDAFKRESLWMALVRMASLGRMLTKNARKPIPTTTGDLLHCVDAIVIDQGPNYILAKRIQHWRCIVAREENKCVVSTNIAPSTATASVVKNRSFAWAYGGMHNFRPMEVFKQETSNAVMTAMLLYDINSSDSVANPKVSLANPLQLFSEGAFHGGPWRTAHKFTTIGVPSALLYFLSLIINYYLAAYNFVQTVGWSLCLWNVVQFLLQPQANSSVWAVTGSLVTDFQFLAVLEIVHAFLGIVSAQTFTTLVQVFSRLLLVGVATTNPEVHTAPGLQLMLFCWCLTEVVRYGYFALKLLGVEIGILTWLRYSLFFILYPCGVAGELMTAWAGLPTMHQTLAATTDLSHPNTWLYVTLHRGVERYVMGNMADWILYVIFPLYTIGLPSLYMHMIAQRKKVLSKPSKPRAGGKKAKKD